MSEYISKPHEYNGSASKIALVVASAPGGVGKSTLSQLLEASASMAGLKVRVVDADAGNSGYMLETEDSRAQKIRFIIDPDKGGGASSFVARLRGDGVDVVVIDGGAGLTAQDATVVEGFRDVCELLVAGGFSLVSLLPVATSKGQSQAQFQMLFQRLGRLGSVAVACTDASGTGHFPDWLHKMNPVKIDVPRIKIGFLDLRKRFVTPLSSFLNMSHRELFAAQSVFARTCLELVSQHPLSEATAGWNLSALNEISQRASVPNWLSPSDAAEALTSVIECRVEHTMKLWEVHDNARLDPTHPYNPVILLLDRWTAAKEAAGEKLTNGLIQ